MSLCLSTFLAAFLAMPYEERAQCASGLLFFLGGGGWVGLTASRFMNAAY